MHKKKTILTWRTLFLLLRNNITHVLLVEQTRNHNFTLPCIAKFNGVVICFVVDNDRLASPKRQIMTKLNI